MLVKKCTFMSKRCLSVLRFLVVWSGLCFSGCQDDTVDFSVIEATDSGTNSALTIEEARVIYEEYTTEHTRSGVDICRDMPLNPGWIENDWKYAATSLAGANSYVSVPSQVSKAYLVKSPHNTGWVRMVQKLVVVQEDSTRRNNVYLLSIIPEGEYVRAYPEVIAEACKGGDMPDDFSGLIVYTRLEGGMVVYAGWYQEGWLGKEVFIFDKNYSFEENITRLNEVLKGYHVEEVKEATRSAFGWMGGDIGGSTGGNMGGSTGGNMGGSTGGGNDWMYRTEGAPFYRDGFKCWYATDSSGKRYVVADMNFDGHPDTILGDDASVGGGNSGSGWGGSTGGGNIGGGSTGGSWGGSSGGNINPGGIEPTWKPAPKPEPTPEKPADLSAYHGSDNYYLMRKEDFERRYPDSIAPDYYENYGDFYLREFKYKTRPKLSPDGQKWCDSTLLYLQQEMSKLLDEQTNIESDSDIFTEKAFDTHVIAYNRAKICTLSMTDKMLIFTTVYHSNLLSANGLRQVRRILYQQVVEWRSDSEFAKRQAKEASANWKRYLYMLEQWLQKEDPRKVKTKTTEQTMTAEEIMELLFRDLVDYSRYAFGDEFYFPI